MTTLPEQHAVGPAFTVHVLYTFDVCDPHGSASANPFRSGHGELTMLKNSMLSVVRAAVQCASEGIAFVIHAYTTTPDSLLTHVQHIVQYAAGIVDVNVVTMDRSALSAFGIGDSHATRAHAQFERGRAGHARIHIVPELLRALVREETTATRHAVLYLDNDTQLLPMQCAPCIRRLADHDTVCLAYEREDGTLSSLLGSGAASVRSVHPHVDIGVTHVSNNGVLWFPANTVGIDVAERVRDTYLSLPPGAPMRYLHDMVAVSIVWKDDSTCKVHKDTLGYPRGPTARLEHVVASDSHEARAFPFVDHYWRMKSKPEHMSQMMGQLLQWRLEQDSLELSRDTNVDERQLLNRAENDVEELRSAARRCGMITSGSALYMPPVHQRMNLIAMRRPRSYHSRILAEFMHSNRASVRLSTTHQPRVDAGHGSGVRLQDTGVSSIFNALVSKFRTSPVSMISSMGST